MSPDAWYYAAGFLALLVPAALIASLMRRQAMLKDAAGAPQSMSIKQGPRRDEARVASDTAVEERIEENVGDDGTASNDADQHKMDAREAWDSARNVIKPQISFLHAEMKRELETDEEKFAYEAGVLLHHLDGRLAEADAMMVVAFYAAETYGKGQHGKALFTAFRANPESAARKMGAADLEQLHVRMSEARAEV